MRKYEAMFLFHPELDDEKLGKEIDSVKTIIKDQGKGNVESENLGKKSTAYAVAKQREGYYVAFNFDANPLAIVEIKKGLKHRSNILRSVFFVKE